MTILMFIVIWLLALQLAPLAGPAWAGIACATLFGLVMAKRKKCVRYTGAHRR